MKGRVTAVGGTCSKYIIYLCVNMAFVTVCSNFVEEYLKEYL